jgi:hypothetical protein
MGLFGYFKALSRLTVIETALIQQEKRMEEIETDWVDMHSRCRKLMLRAERAEAQREVGVESPVSTAPNGDGQEPSSLGAHPGRLLNPHQLEVQQQILKRRAGL